MFDIILTVVIFHSVSAVALFLFAVSGYARQSARELAAAGKAQARTQDYAAGYSHG